MPSKASVLQIKPVVNCPLTSTPVHCEHGEEIIL